MNVLFFPYWPANPYQPNLAKALGERDVDVQGVCDTSLSELIRSVKGKDVLHLHWTNPYMLAPTLLTSAKCSFYFFKFLIKQKRIGRKLVWTIHNLAEHEPRHPRFELLCHKLLARLTDGIIVHSIYAKKRVVEVYKLGHRVDKISVIPHGNYIGNYPQGISREQARVKLGIEADKTVFLFLGAIRAYKGIPDLVAAFTKIATGNETLVLAGNPLNEQIESEISQLTARKKDIIYSPKFVNDEEIQIYMNAADVVVFPFRDIFTSGSVLLAMSFAKAIIIPDLESLAEIKEAGGAITYDPHDKNSLGRAIASALSVDLQKLGNCNLQEAEKLSWDAIADETFKFYSRILGL